jgi:glucose dehydrogenase
MDGEMPEIAADYKVSSEPTNSVGFGRTPSGEQFAPYDQITRDNVAKLKIAWTFRSGDITGNGRENQNTPLQIGNTLYACTPTNQVFALQGDTAKELWHYNPEVSVKDSANNPSWYGTMNGGGQSIDKRHDIMIVNDMRVAMKGRLLTREDEIRRTGETGKTQPGVGSSTSVHPWLHRTRQPTN